MLTKASNVEDKICPDYIDSVHGVGFFLTRCKWPLKSLRKLKLLSKRIRYDKSWQIIVDWLVAKTNIN